jgi:hypothetical protein
MFAQLVQREEEFANTLIKDIVSKADGVFLWVALVVSSLISGMAFGDRVSDLKRRLDNLPPDLEKLYEKMLLSLDPFYLEHAAQLFSLVKIGTNPLSLLNASFADEDDLDFALRCEIRPLPMDEIVLRMDTMRRRINSRCKGLLEIKRSISLSDGSTHGVSSLEDPAVQYLHRTVKDYLEGDQAQRVLRPAVRSTYDPELRRLAGNIAYLKGVATSNRQISQDLAIGCFEHSRNVLQSNLPRMILLLDELKRVISIQGPSIVELVFKPASGLRRSGHRATFSDLPGRSAWAIDDAFLSITVQHSVVEYVQAKAEAGCIIQKPISWPLLVDALQVLEQPSLNPSQGLRTIQCLLDKDADPNYMFFPQQDERSRGNFSPLTVLLASILEVAHYTTSEATSRQVLSMFQAARLLVRVGGIANVAIDTAFVAFAEPVVGLSVSQLIRSKEVRSARSSFRKALQEFSQNENTDASMLEAQASHLQRLAYSYSLEKGPTWQQRVMKVVCCA